MITHLLTCPACGPFGIRARRRARAADDALHIAWAARLAEQTRAGVTA